MPAVDSQVTEGRRVEGARASDPCVRYGFAGELLTLTAIRLPIVVTGPVQVYST